ncbi:hypothetical protein OGAPHI_000238 [Ogataea philodendri]|uniref:Uncharacterized protein n=1 Tax=Ogataea philodendri TaxID=1378263 RepID=A0A9P8PH33_9ASCO|nr:uncharacterized protein OGAPHI_000238 [Ogataea philodendri]KAH3671535.1 hypothetical protein OGAPHI_000238 [Ogataea philodendri]
MQGLVDQHLSSLGCPVRNGSLSIMERNVVVWISVVLALIVLWIGKHVVDVSDLFWTNFLASDLVEVWRSGTSPEIWPRDHLRKPGVLATTNNDVTTAFIEFWGGVRQAADNSLVLEGQVVHKLGREIEEARTVVLTESVPGLSVKQDVLNERLSIFQNLSFSQRIAQRVFLHGFENLDKVVLERDISSDDIFRSNLVKRVLRWRLVACERERSIVCSLALGFVDRGNFRAFCVTS